MTTVKILCIGDLHIKVSNILETKLLTKNILSIIDEYNPDVVVNSGDTLHRHNIIDSVAQVESIKMFREISLKKPLIVLIGNHDLPSNTSYLSENTSILCVKSI